MQETQPATSPAHTGAVITTVDGAGGADDLLSEASRAKQRTPVLNASEEPVPHQITCNQFRDLHAFTSAPPLDWRHADKHTVPAIYLVPLGLVLLKIQEMFMLSSASVLYIPFQSKPEPLVF